MRDRARARLKALEDSLRTGKPEILVIMAIDRDPAEVEAEVARLLAQAGRAGAPIIIMDR